jgi:hypothetical protein
MCEIDRGPGMQSSSFLTAAFDNMIGDIARKRRRLFSVLLLLASLRSAAQDLAPRAYLITPIHSNAITLTYSFFDGELLFEGTVPITDATARVSVPILSIYHATRFFGRTASFTASLPYGIGSFRGTVLSTQTNAYRSGLFDSSYRLSINLIGGPAMDLADFRDWSQKMLVGISVRLVAPTGQYDSTKLINYGAHRWAFKPEVGVSRRWGHWIVDTYGGVWFYTENSEFFSRNQFSPGVNTQEQAPIFAFEGHVSYDVKPRLWASLDGNFWHGGRTSLNGTINPSTVQNNSRVGITCSLPVTKHQSLKLSYNRGAYVRFGGKYDNISVGWQYSWIGKPNW